MMSAMPYLRLSGTSSPRCRSVGACSEIARFGMIGSRASRSSAGSRPTVESVTRRGGSAKPVLVGQNPQRLHRLVVVVQRFAHAHQHDVEGACPAARARRPAPGPDRRSRRRSGSGPAPSFPSGRRRTPSRTRPGSRCRRSCAGVSGMNTDSIWRPSASRSRNFSVPSIDRSRATSRGVASVKSAPGRRAAPATGRSSRSRSVTPRR